MLIAPSKQTPHLPPPSAMLIQKPTFVKRIVFNGLMTTKFKFCVIGLCHSYETLRFAQVIKITYFNYFTILKLRIVEFC